MGELNERAFDALLSEALAAEALSRSDALQKEKDSAPGEGFSEAHKAKMRALFAKGKREGAIGKLLSYAVAAVFMLVVAGAAVYALRPPGIITPSQSEQPGTSPLWHDLGERGNSSGNIANGGFVAEYGGRVYYKHISGGGLYSVKLDGSDNRKLSDDSADFINVVGGRVYYTNAVQDGGGLYSVKLDGSDRQKLSADIAYFTIAAGGNLYYVEGIVTGEGHFFGGGAIYSMNLDGTGRQRIGDDEVYTLEPLVVGDRLYYSNNKDGGKFYSIKLDGSDRQTLCDDRATAYFAEGDRLYYTNPGDNFALYSIKLDGTSRQKVIDEWSSAGFNIADGVLYCAPTGDNGGGLYAMSLDGSDRQKLSPFIVGTVAVAGGRLYFPQSDGDSGRLYTMNLDGSDEMSMEEFVRGGAAALPADPGERGNTAGNIANEGYVAQKNGRIYYRDGTALYSANLNGTGRQKLCDDSPAYINVIGDRLYYQNISDGGKLYTMKTNGSDKRALNNEMTWCPTAIGDRVYYLNGDDGGKLYSIKTDGSDRRKLGDNPAMAFSVADGVIYYSEAVRKDPNGTGRYDMPGNLYSIKTDGSDRRKLGDDRTAFIVAEGDTVYYSNQSDGGKLYSIKTDGSDRRKLNDNTSQYINVVGDTVYYSVWNADTAVGIHSVIIMGSGEFEHKLTDTAGPVAWAGNYLYRTELSPFNKLHIMKLDGSDEMSMEDFVNGGAPR
ncbi:MAG: DUF5050 domain-containing protein [Oscillospiraceae bacterium]|jgi:hypothetical protein|nr:DUF5050 domain-containing protein [Oscillospiraceae bacterium]